MNYQMRFERAAAIIDEHGKYRKCTFVLNGPLPRYLALELDPGGMILEAQQADTLAEIVPLLELNYADSEDTEIHDLDTGQILHPTYQRIYQIPRIYLADSDTIAYEAPADSLVRRIQAVSADDAADNRQDEFRLTAFPAGS